jgi:hypothetical protein
MRTKITITKLPTGYLMDYAGRFGGGGSMIAGKTPEDAAGKLRWAIDRYVDTNPEGGDYHAPPEVLDALDANTVDAAGPGKGARLSYYASPDALVAIQGPSASPRAPANPAP